MGFGEILLLALGLAMDATAVSAARGLSVDAVHPRHMLLVALYFGGSQALMPLLGWALGAWLGPWLEAWDHWIAFVLLAFIGGKMLWEAWGDREDQGRDGDDGAAEPERDPFGWKLMLLLAIATSIDALAVGFTLPMLGAPFVSSLVTIGVTTALLSIAGLLAGLRFGAMLGKRLDVAGGLVLIGLGCKILLEHLGVLS